MKGRTNGSTRDYEPNLKYTEITAVVDKKDFVKEIQWGSVEDAVHHTD